MNMWLIIFIALLTGRKARSVDCLEADDIDSFLQTNLLTFSICELFNLSFQFNLLTFIMDRAADDQRFADIFSYDS